MGFVGAHSPHGESRSESPYRCNSDTVCHGDKTSERSTYKAIIIYYSDFK